jgi:hypothetical protein
MECKLWCCRVLSLVCTMRVDIRLSKLLAQYKSEYQRGGYAKPAEKKGGGLLSFMSEKGSRATTRGGYVRLEETTGDGDGAAPSEQRVSTTSRAARAKGLFEVLSLEVDISGDGNSDLVETLLDLTFYESQELVSAALELVVRHFQQRAVLHRCGRAVQLLVKPEVIKFYSVFDELIRQLQRLSARRRLFGHELYAAVRLMGLLTLYCYEEVAGSARLSHGSRRSLLTRGTARSGTASTDHTAGLYLLLIGRATATLGSDQLVMVHRDEHGGAAPRPLRRGDKLQLEGSLYKVKAAEGEAVTLDRPFELELPAGVHKGTPAVPPALQGGTGEVWVMKEEHSPEMNIDSQLLLLNMGAHRPALQLLELPFTLDAILPQDLETRAVMRACYRTPSESRTRNLLIPRAQPADQEIDTSHLAAGLLKAMTSGCAKMQLELVPSLPTFVEHTRAHLVSHDISPTGCINAIFKENRTVCAQVEEGTVRPSERRTDPLPARACRCALPAGPPLLRFATLSAWPPRSTLRALYDSCEA